MRLHRSFSNTALRTAPLVLAVCCAGCWEKIEYTGPRTAVAPPRKPTAEVAGQPAERAEPAMAQPAAVPDSPVAAVERAEPLPPTEPPRESATPPAAVAASSSKPDDDRYASTAADNSIPPAATPPAAMPPTTDATANPATSDEANSTAKHTDATPVSATAETPPPKAIDSYRAAWLMGSRLSLAALANDRRVAADNVPIWLEDARTAAKLLGTTVADLPEPAAADDKSLASQQVVNYLVATGQRIGPELSKQHGPEESALFEVALKSNILLLLYTPGASAGDSIAVAISRRAAPQAKLPDELWKPLVDALGKSASQSDIRAAVRKMHVDVDRYLAERAEHKAQ